MKKRKTQQAQEAPKAQKVDFIQFDGDKVIIGRKTSRKRKPLSEMSEHERQVTLEDLAITGEIVSEQLHTRSGEPMPEGVTIKEEFERLDRATMLLDKVASSEKLYHLMPYIRKALQEPKFKNVTFEEVILNTDKKLNAYDTKCKAAEALSLAISLRQEAVKEGQRTRAEEARGIQLVEAEKRNKKGIKPYYQKRDDNITLTTGLFTNSLFTPKPDFIDRPSREDRVRKALDMLYATPGDKKVKMQALFSIDYDYLSKFGISEEDPNFLDYGYTFFVMSIVDQMRLEGNLDTSLTQILKRLGIPPSQKEMQKLLIALWIGSSIDTTVNNKAVLEEWNKDTTHWTLVKGRVIPVSIDMDFEMIGNNLSQVKIHIDNVSPAYRVSEPLSQISGIDNNIFKLYTGRKTTKYWRILRYLLKEISWMNNKSGKKRKPVLTYSNIFEWCGDENGHQKDATRKLTRELLEQCFMKLHYIDSFIEDPDGNKIYISPLTEKQRLMQIAKDKKGLPDGKKK